MARPFLPILLLVAVVLTACGDDGADVEPTAVPAATLPPQLASHTITTIEIDGEPWRVAVADTATLRSAGLMGVQDLGSLDGMLFVFEDAAERSFWMKDTLIPLDIAFFTDTGVLVSVAQMEPCDPGATCPSYVSDGPARFAVEGRAGSLVSLATGSVLVVD